MAAREAHRKVRSENPVSMLTTALTHSSHIIFFPQQSTVDFMHALYMTQSGSDKSLVGFVYFFFCSVAVEVQRSVKDRVNVQSIQ